jgi:hypothetical protein
MRFRLLLSAVLIPALTSGCSLLIASSGKDLSKLTTKEEVHKEFGEPASTGLIEGHPYEDFTTRRKIGDPIGSERAGMGCAMTFGTIELIAFPFELYRVTRGTVLGQDLRFAYDNSGNVIRVFLDGQKLEVTWGLDYWAEEEYAASQQKKVETQSHDQTPADSPNP